MDATGYYETNKDFREYVDKYCKKMGKSVKEALQDLIVLSYLEYLQAL